MNESTCTPETNDHSGKDEAEHGQYSIQLASKISGVGVHTIRAWEKRYQAVVPQRNSSGRREYCDADIERLSLLSELCNLGHSIGKVAHLSTADLKEQLDKLGRQVESASHGTHVSAPVEKVQLTKEGVKENIEAIFDDLLQYNLNKIASRFEPIKNSINRRELALKLIHPLFERLQILVKEGTLSSAQEQALLAIIKFQVGNILFRGNNPKSPRPQKIILCSPEGSYCEFGIIQAALLCSYYNFQFSYLGPNVPVETLADAYSSLGANLILIESRKDAMKMDNTKFKQYLERVHSHTGNAKIVTGRGNLDTEDFINHSAITVLDNISALDTFLADL